MILIKKTCSSVGKTLVSNVTKGWAVGLRVAWTSDAKLEVN